MKRKLSLLSVIVILGAATTLTTSKSIDKTSDFYDLSLNSLEALSWCEVKDPDGKIVLNCQGEKTCSKKNPSGPGTLNRRTGFVENKLQSGRQ